MTIKIREIYSPNFNSKPRKINTIKFLIFHYTGMRTEKLAIRRLTKIQSEVSTHYLIKKDGEIIRMIPDNYIAWHAGISKWKNYKSLNKSSIGIEISNPGHQYKYVNFFLLHFLKIHLFTSLSEHWKHMKKLLMENILIQKETTQF